MGISKRALLMLVARADQQGMSDHTKQIGRAGTLKRVALSEKPVLF